MGPPNFELRRKSDQLVTPLTPPQAKNLSEGENRSGGGDAEGGGGGKAVLSSAPSEAPSEGGSERASE